MISQPITITTILLGIQGLVLFLATRRSLERLFSVLPPLFWIYFLPMMLSTVGMLPAKHSVYESITMNLLPAGLILILLPVNLERILRLGPQALIVMLSGSLGIILGAPVVIFFLRPWLPADIWKGFGALSASWIGGSSNMLAIKEAIGTPDDLLFLMIITDTVVVYLWMAGLIALSNVQERFDRWNKAKIDLLRTIASRVSRLEKKNQVLEVYHLSSIVALSLIGSRICFFIAQNLPVVENLVAPFTWTVILATLVGILLSETPAQELESYGASKIGYLMLFLVLASIG
ncbi:MAG: DUF819 family protein, partial [Candidatus Omnitrophica bacterium]|nr:DUF819 family protein [Candidatus Omnitrophota bacterium]